MISEIPSHEKVLFQLKKIVNKRIERRKKRGYIAGYVSFFTFFTIFPIVLSQIVSQGKPLNPYLLFLDLFFPIIGILGIPVLIWKIKHLIIPELSLIITDKKVYIENTPSYFRIKWKSELNLNDIIGLTFKKRKKDEKGDFGTVNIISLDLKKIRNNDIDIGIDLDLNHENEIRFDSIENIPNFRNFQNILESILYEFGNIKQNWEHIKKNNHFKNIQEVTLSKTRLKIIKRSQKRKSLYILLSPLIGLTCSFLLTGLIFFFISSQSADDFNSLITTLVQSPFFILYFIIITPILSVGFLADIIIMRKRSIPKNFLLKFDDDGACILDIHSKEVHKKILISETLSIDYFKIYKPTDTIIKWYDNMEGIKILPSPDSRDFIRFGPIDDFAKIFTILFYYFIILKAEKGLLLSRNRLMSGIKGTQIKHLEKEYEQEKEVDGISKEITLPPIDISQDILSPIKKYFNPGEEIMLTYTPTSSNSKRYLIILLSIVIFFIGLIGLILLTTDFYVFKYSNKLPLQVLFICLIILGIFVLFIELLSLAGIRLIKVLYVFTNQKIIVKYSKSYSLTLYGNIQSIGRSGLKKKRENIIISLKKPINSPFTDKYSITLFHVPENILLYQQITGLKKRYQNITTDNAVPKREKEQTIQDKIKNIISNYYYLEIYEDQGKTFIPKCIIKNKDIIPQETFKQMQDELKYLGFEANFYPIKEKNLKQYNLESEEDQKRYEVSFVPKEFATPLNKKKRNTFIQLSLIIITSITVLLSAIFYLRLIEPYFGSYGFFTPLSFWSFVSFCLGMLFIIIVHEFGHFIFSKRHKLDVSHPYLIPGPPPIGMLGAFVSIKDNPQTRNQKFDVAIGGIAFGLIISLVLVSIGLLLSIQVDTMTYIQDTATYFGRTETYQARALSENLNSFNLMFLAFRFLFIKAPTYGIFYGYMLPQNILVIHPLAYAGWIGLLISGLNLIPISFQDGGHLLKTIFPTRYTKTIGAIIALVIFLSFGIEWYFLAFLGLPGACRELNQERSAIDVPNPTIPLTLSRKIFAISLIGIFIFLYPLSFSNLIYGFGF